MLVTKPIPLLLLFLCCFTVGTASAQKPTDSGFLEKSLVTRFLNLWVKSDKGERLNEFIAPAYLQKNDLNFENHKINNYAPVDFAIVYYNNGLVSARIWGENHNWEHLVVFQVINTKKSYYLNPSGHNEKFIDPWFLVKHGVKDDL